MNAWVENSKAAMEPARELGELTKRAFAKMSEQQMAVTKEYMDFSVRGLQLFSTARDPRALMNDQVALAKEMGDKMIANAEAFAKLATETQAELASWAEKTAETAVAKASDAAGRAA
jgi:phasin family protein